VGLDQIILLDESDLTGVQDESNGTICLLLEGVQVNDQVQNVAVHLDNVRQIIRDGSPVDAIAMEQDYGEVLALKNTPDFVLLLIDWMDYSVHKHVTRSYHIMCDPIRIELAR
jgi:hypothetical protein